MSKNGNKTREDIMAHTGVPQGYCLFAFLFILYRVQALKHTRTTTENEHNHSKVRHDAIYIYILSCDTFILEHVGEIMADIIY